MHKLAVSVLSLCFISSFCWLSNGACVLEKCGMVVHTPLGLPAGLVREPSS